MNKLGIDMYLSIYRMIKFYFKLNVLEKVMIFIARTTPDIGVISSVSIILYIV